MDKHISFNYGYNTEYKSRVALLKEVGFDGIMPMCESSPEFIKSMEYAQNEGLVIESIHLPFREIVNDLWLPGEGGEHYVDVMIDGGKVATKVGVDKLTLHLSSSPTPPPMSEIGFERLRRIADFYAENNLTLCIENLRRIDYFRAVVDGIPGTKICYDVGHHNIYYPHSFDMMEYKDRVEIVHLHDNFGDKDEHYLPFEGNCDWVRIVRELANMPRVKTLTLEVHGSREKDLKERDFLVRAMDASTRIEKMIAESK